MGNNSCVFLFGNGDIIISIAAAILQIFPLSARKELGYFDNSSCNMQLAPIKLEALETQRIINDSQGIFVLFLHLTAWLPFTVLMGASARTSNYYLVLFSNSIRPCLMLYSYGVPN